MTSNPLAAALDFALTSFDRSPTPASDAIARSISHTETIHLPYDADAMMDLLVECEDSTESETETEYWGTDETGNEWQVHVAREA